jgi:hypothetical protein
MLRRVLLSLPGGEDAFDAGRTMLRNRAASCGTTATTVLSSSGQEYLTNADRQHHWSPLRVFVVPFVTPIANNLLAKPVPRDACDDAAVHWQSAVAEGTLEALEDHLRHFSTCAFADSARRRIEVERKKQSQGAPQPAPSEVEVQRREREQRDRLDRERVANEQGISRFISPVVPTAGCCRGRT